VQQQEVDVMARTEAEHLSVEERGSLGKRAREKTGPAANAGWVPAADRSDPVSLLVEQDRTREPDLVPVRHGRMMVSPFTFYRGAAKIMAHDLAGTPTAGLTVQLCGDAHLENFGLFASPERLLLFDVNDFDETLPGPFEYDVKRLAASFVVAARNNGFSPTDARAVATASAASYHEAMTSFAQMRTLDIWYARLDEDELTRAIRADVAQERQLAKGDKHHKGKQDKKKVKQAEKMEKGAGKTEAKAHTRDSLQALSKLGELVNGHYQIVSQPPIVVPARELRSTYGMSAADVHKALRDQFRAYRDTLEGDRRRVLERFEIVDTARKVVGVGSVGTRAFIVLLQGRDANDPLFLQVKEATASVLEDHLPKSRFRQHGERVVRGQRMMQAASDIFLGWTKGVDANRHYYWRQLRDMKGSADVEAMTPASMTFYAHTCGWTLARAHARSGDPIAIATYLGDDDAFERAIADFAEHYADQNERDYEQFAAQVQSGRLEAVAGV
jgi:uncharacterized protein (DUF2252 family)